MSEAGFPLKTRGQLGAVAELRWRMFVHSLFSTRGKLELVSRAIVSLLFAAVGLGGAVGLGLGAYYAVAENELEYLAIPLWLVFVFWQVFPVVATAFTNNPDSSDLLRFPFSYRSYFLIRLVYGLFDPFTAVSGLWLLGMLTGIGLARPSLLAWALPALLLFAGFNLLFMQMVFAWVERWLAQRRTREIMGGLLVLCMLSFSFIGPLVAYFSKRSAPDFQYFVGMLRFVQGVLPPGLAAAAMAQAAHGEFIAGFRSLLLLVAISLAAARLLHLRLRAQFRGENFSEAGARGPAGKVNNLRLGWNLPGFPPAVAAVFEKEVRYLGRSGPMLLTLLTPIFMLALLRLGSMGPAGPSRGFLTRMPNMIFPVAVAFALQALTNLIYNNFGGDGSGIQFFYASPVGFRQIVLGKNLTHAGVLLSNTLLVWLAVTYLFGRPAFDVTVATLAGLLFAAPINFTVGNLVSLYSPKRVDFSTFGRQTAAQITVLISVGVQIVVVAAGAGAFWIARLYQNFWIAALLFLVLSAVSFTAYGVALHYADRIARERRESLVSELCRV